jgi:hypothetical protein
MTNSDPSPNGTGDKRLQAFQLGWSLAEILGRVRRGARPSQEETSRSSDYSPRLSVSTGELSAGADQFNDAVGRLETLASALGVIGEKDGIEAPIRVPIERLKCALRGEESDFGPPLRLRHELQEWGLTARARLLAQDWKLAEAMNIGASLADTFWYMRRAMESSSEIQAEAAAERKDEDWRRLLSDYRLKVERTQLAGLVEALPPYLTGILNHHLSRWQIGRELAYDKQGRLYRLPWYRRLHWLSRASLPIGKTQRRRESPRLSPKDENAIQQALERQVRRWQDMLFGWRRPDEFLWWIDRQSITLLRSLGLLFVFIVVGIGLALLAYGWGYILNLVIGPAVPDVLAKGALDDRLKLLSAAVGWLATTSMAIRTIVGWVPGIHHWLDQNLTAWFIAQRTLVRWNSVYVKRAEGSDHETT